MKKFKKAILWAILPIAAIPIILVAAVMAIFILPAAKTNRAAK